MPETAQPLTDPAVLADLKVMARRLLPSGAACAVRDPGTPQPALWPDEATSVASARPSRQQEFAAGRAAARAAMARLGLPAAAIPATPDRAPLWPRGVTGSITHTRRACLAAVAPTARIPALGLDLEEATALDRALWPEICLPDELNWLAARPAHQQAALATLIFSAKEAAYKCQYPLTGQLFGFDRLAITLDPDDQGFQATFTADTGRFASGSALKGRFATCHDMILTLVTL